MLFYCGFDGSRASDRDTKLFVISKHAAQATQEATGSTKSLVPHFNLAPQKNSQTDDQMPPSEGALNDRAETQRAPELRSQL